MMWPNMATRLFCKAGAPASKMGPNVSWFVGRDGGECLGRCC